MKKADCKILGESREFQRKGDSGETVTFYFCPNCGTTLYWIIPFFPNQIAIACGGFAGQPIPDPTFSVYEERMHNWIQIPEGAERMD